MSPFEKQMALEVPPGTPEDTFTKNGPHWTPAGRPIMGAILMPQAILAASKTIPAGFQIHHLSAQFFHAGVLKPTLTFRVSRTSDSKNNAARTVHLVQSGRRFASIALSFIRKPLKDKLSLSYQPRMLEDVDEPDDGLDDIETLAEGILQGQILDMVIKPNSINFHENRTRFWLKIGGISSPPGSIMHHCGLAGLTDFFLLDTFVRLHNLQLGLGEGKVGKGHSDSPYNKSTRGLAPNLQDWPKSDFSAMVTLNHTIHFHDLDGLKADEWILMEGSTTWASGGRVLLHSRLWTRSGRLVATCTQEGYARLRKDAAERIAKSNL